MLLPVNQIFPNPDQPRTVFEKTELDELAQSIQYNGLIQPITVEAVADNGGYMLVDGERRWRAHRQLGLEMIEAHVRPATNHNGRERLMHALVANIQREDMGAVDEARAFKLLMDDLGSSTAVAEKVGLSVSSVTNRMSLLSFSPSIQALYNTGKLPFDIPSIRALLALPEEARERIAMAAAARGVSGQILKKMCAAAHKPDYEAVTNKKYVSVKREVHIGPFDALAMVSKPVDQKIADCARNTCKACPLYSMASVTTCRECPMVDFLRRVANAAQ